MQNDKVKKLKGLRSDPTEQTGLSAMFQAPTAPPTPKKSAAKKEEVRLSFLISNQHDQDIRMFCAVTGKKFKNIVVDALENFFAEGATRQITNMRILDGSGSRQVGVNVPVELKAQLDEYVSKEKVAMRYVVEGLVSEYITKNK